MIPWVYCIVFVYAVALCRIGEMMSIVIWIIYVYVSQEAGGK